MARFEARLEAQLEHMMDNGHDSSAICAEETGGLATLSDAGEATELIKAHYEMQKGAFVSQWEETPGSIRVFSEVSAVPMWNHEAALGPVQHGLASLMENTRATWPRLDRRPVIYCIEHPELSDTAAPIKAGGFEPCDRESWMVYGETSAPPCSSDLRICEARTIAEIEAFTEVFGAAYRTEDTAYRKLFRRDLDQPASERRIQHFLGYAGEQAVSIASLVWLDKLACIYNVGTVPRFRKQGLAGRLLAPVIREALASGCRRLFLQVTAGSTAERLYTRLGFKTAFRRRGYWLSHWTASQPRSQESQPTSEAPRAFLSALLREDLGPGARPDSRTRHLIRWPDGSSEAVFEASRRLGIRPEIPYLAAWSVLLSRYSGETRIGFGLRRARGWVLDASISIEEEQSVGEWLKQLDIQFGSLEQSNHDTASACDTGLEFLPVGDGGHTEAGAGCILTWCIDGLRAHTSELRYDNSSLREDVVARLSAHLLTLLLDLSRHPEKRVAALEILTEVERAGLLACDNAEEASTAEFQAVHRLFESQAARAGSALAVTKAHAVDSASDENAITYGELNLRANQLAGQLRNLGAGPGTVVAVCLDRSPEMITAVLATFKAGAVCLPLDPAYPMDRLRFMLSDAKVDFVFADGPTGARLQSGSPKLVCIDPVNPALASQSAPNPEWIMQPENAAYIIYTSGSTGNPKGVVVPHTAIARHCVEANKDYALGSGDRVLQFNSLSFDAAFEQIFCTLISGATLVLRGPEIWSPAEFGRCLERSKLSVVDLPTSYWSQLVRYWSENPLAVPRQLPRLVIVGGEAMPMEALELWRRLPVRGVRLINAYGPTETTITSTAFEVTPEWLDGPLPKRVPIGRPRGPRSIYILDSRKRLVPSGIPGELYIGGALLATGYLNRPELTRERFVPDPFSSPHGARLYRTGDLVRYLPDGNLEFLGRVDQQVKIRGFRVELGEIEAGLRQCPGVRDCAVAVCENQAHRELSAFVVAKNGSPPSASELRASLRQRLPAYMIPSSFVVLESLPMLPGGKIDRRRLSSLAAESGQTGSAGPRSPLELQLRLVFERILRRSGIGIDENFFELGGDSLQALELIVATERISGRSLPLEALYQSPTIEALAALLEKDDASVNRSCLVPLQTGGPRPPLFVVHTTPGDILGYGNLIYHLDPGQPCYGLQSLGLIDPKQSHRRVQDMARHYVSLLPSVQPEGPYYLAGWCYGGIVAVEMARLLVALGETVAFVGLLETVAPRASWLVPRYYLHRLACFLRMRPGQWKRYLRKKVIYRREVKLANRMRFRRVEASDPAVSSVVEEQNRRRARLEHVYNANLHALKLYKPGYYPGRVTLFNASELDEGVIPDPLYAWRGLAAEIEVHNVPGDHDTMLTEPNVAELARKLDAVLRQVQAKPEHAGRSPGLVNRPNLQNA